MAITIEDLVTTHRTLGEVAQQMENQGHFAVAGMMMTIGDILSDAMAAYSIVEAEVKLDEASMGAIEDDASRSEGS